MIVLNNPAKQAVVQQAVVQQATVLRFDVVDTQSMRAVGSAKTRQRASISAEQRNQRYGAHRYAVKAVWSDEVGEYNA